MSRWSWPWSVGSGVLRRDVVRWCRRGLPVPARAPRPHRRGDGRIHPGALTVGSAHGLPGSLLPSCSPTTPSARFRTSKTLVWSPRPPGRPRTPQRCSDGSLVAPCPGPLRDGVARDDRGVGRRIRPLPLHRDVPDDRVPHRDRARVAVRSTSKRCGSTARCWSLGSTTGSTTVGPSCASPTATRGRPVLAALVRRPRRALDHVHLRC